MINVSQEDCTRTKSPPKIIREGELEIVGLTDDFTDWKIILSLLFFLDYDLEKYITLSFFVTRDWDCYVATFCCLSQFLPLYQAIYYWVLENAVPHTSAEKTWHIIGLVKKSSSQMLRRYFVMLPPIIVGKTILTQRKNKKI